MSNLRSLIPCRESEILTTHLDTCMLLTAGIERKLTVDSCDVRSTSFMRLLIALSSSFVFACFVGVA